MATGVHGDGRSAEQLSGAAVLAAVRRAGSATGRASSVPIKSTSKRPSSGRPLGSIHHPLPRYRRWRRSRRMRPPRTFSSTDTRTSPTFQRANTLSVASRYDIRPPRAFAARSRAGRSRRSCRRSRRSRRAPVRTAHERCARQIDLASRRSTRRRPPHRYGGDLQRTKSPGPRLSRRSRPRARRLPHHPMTDRPRRRRRAVRRPSPQRRSRADRVGPAARRRVCRRSGRDSPRRSPAEASGGRSRRCPTRD